MNEITKDLDNVSELLKSSKIYGLEAEVVLWSLYALKTDPSLSIEDAIQIGLNEWVK